MIRAQHLASCVRPVALVALLLGACGTVESSSPGASADLVDASNNPPDAAPNTPDAGSFGIVGSSYMEGVPGAKQPNSYLGSPGYAGPCSALSSETPTYSKKGTVDTLCIAFKA